MTCTLPIPAAEPGSAPEPAIADNAPAGEAAPAVPVAAPAAPAAAGSRRRRLWELSADARRLLVAMSLAPQTLRQVSQQALSRLHQARCRMQGSDTDVLFSVLHDLGSRNVLSEALQRALEHRHAHALRQYKGLRNTEALCEAWESALQGHDMPAHLWALLTHPLGAALQDAAVMDAQAWVFEQARAGLQTRGAAERDNHRLLQLQAQLQQAQLRCQQLQAETALQLQAARQELATLRGERARLQAALSAQGLARPDLASEASAATVSEARILQHRTPHRPAGAALLPARMPPAVRASQPPTLRGAAPTAVAQGRPLLKPGHRVLCVGGMPRAQQQYRSIVEGAGARFAYHDGGVEDSPQRLQQQLSAADLVVCQAGCLNHAAYRTIKGHCKRLDKPCVYLDRPSLALFARSLGAAPDARVAPSGEEHRA